jgi:hypothetical protein
MCVLFYFTKAKIKQHAFYLRNSTNPNKLFFFLILNKYCQGFASKMCFLGFTKNSTYDLNSGNKQSKFKYQDNWKEGKSNKRREEKINETYFRSAICFKVVELRLWLAIIKDELFCNFCNI